MNHVLMLLFLLQVSVYNCSKKCKAGQGFTLKGKCCGVCAPCASGEISDGNRKSFIPNLNYTAQKNKSNADLNE